MIHEASFRGPNVTPIQNAMCILGMALVSFILMAAPMEGLCFTGLSEYNRLGFWRMRDHNHMTGRRGGGSHSNACSTTARLMSPVSKKHTNNVDKPSLEVRWVVSVVRLVSASRLQLKVLVLELYRNLRGPYTNNKRAPGSPSTRRHSCSSFLVYVLCSAWGDIKYYQKRNCIGASR